MAVRATSATNLVLPMPPLSTSVISLVRPASRLTPPRSRLRPMKPVANLASLRGPAAHRGQRKQTAKQMRGRNIHSKMTGEEDPPSTKNGYRTRTFHSDARWRGF